MKQTSTKSIWHSLKTWLTNEKNGSQTLATSEPTTSALIPEPLVAILGNSGLVYLKRNMLPLVPIYEAIMKTGIWDLDKLGLEKIQLGSENCVTIP